MYKDGPKWGRIEQTRLQWVTATRGEKKGRLRKEKLNAGFGHHRHQQKRETSKKKNEKIKCCKNHMHEIAGGKVIFMEQE